jgi:hypothetical protein
MSRVVAFAMAMMVYGSAGAAPTDAAHEKDACASLHRLGGVRSLDNTTAVIFSSMGKPAYVIKLSMPLPELRFAYRYAYIDRDGDGQLCGRSRDAIALPGERVRIPATIMSMEQLDTTRIQALETQYSVRLGSKSKNKGLEIADSE